MSRRVRRNDSSRRRLLECNPWISEAFAPKGGPSQETSKLIQANVDAIGRHFSLVPSGRRLMATYHRVKSSSRSGGVLSIEHANRILDRFLKIGRFRLLLA